MTINNSMGSVTGMTSKSVTPTQTTTYTLTATNASGSSTANATVTVTANQANARHPASDVSRSCSGDCQEFYGGRPDLDRQHR